MHRNSKGHTQLQHLRYHALKRLMLYHPRLRATVLEQILHDNVNSGRVDCIDIFLRREDNALCELLTEVKESMSINEAPTQLNGYQCKIERGRGHGNARTVYQGSADGPTQGDYPLDLAHSALYTAVNYRSIIFK